MRHPRLSPSSIRRRLVLAVIASGLLPLTASAHHSFAIFDRTKTTAVKGLVGRFDWTNPHVTIYVDAEGTPTQRYKVETGSINALARSGWKSDSIKVGDKAEVSFHPLKNGDPGGLLIEIKIGSVVLTGGG